MGAIAEGIAGTIQGIGNVGLGIYNAYQQYKNYQYQKDVQKKIFAREDNAIQRRVADAELAGFNKFAVLGEGAGAGNVVSTTAPQADSGMSNGAVDTLNSIYQLAQQRESAKQASILTSQAEANLEKTNQEISNIQKTGQMLDKQNRDLKMKLHENSFRVALSVADMMREMGFAHGTFKINARTGDVENNYIPFYTDSDGNHYSDELHSDFNRAWQRYLTQQEAETKQSEVEGDFAWLKALMSIIGVGASAGANVRKAYKGSK